MVSVVTSSASTLNSSRQFTLPASITAGNLIVISFMSYNSTMSMSTPGYTQIDTSRFGSGTYQTHSTMYYKIAVAGDAGATVTAVGGEYQYAVACTLVLTGHHATSPIDGAGGYSTSTANTYNLTTGTFNTNFSGRDFYFVGSMMFSNGTPTHTATTSGHSILSGSNGSENVYFRQSVLSGTPDVKPSGTIIGPSSVSVSPYESSYVGRVISVRVGNLSPQVTSQSPYNYEPSGQVTLPTVFSWGYSDQESNTQYRYEISYREAGTTGAYTTVTSANGVTATSHTFAANTFTDGKEYEWRLRLDDNQGGGWSQYSTAYFTAGTSKWMYGPQITSSSSTSVTTNRIFATYDFESGVQGWQNNPFFGTYADCTFTNSTTRPKTGTRSMEITWPTTTGQTRLASPSVNGFKIGSTYRIEADVYVPAGSPLVRLDPFLQTAGRGGVILDKDTWVTAWCEFIAVNESITFAVVAEKTTSGQKVFVDNFRVVSPTPEPGNYQLSVRTSDGVGYGPWSASSNTFVVRTGPVAEYLSLTPQRVGSNITVNWKYRDVDSQAQTKYKIRYRKK